MQMEGIDIMDKLLGSYRPRLRNKKWYWNLFSNALYVAVAASYHISQEPYKEKDYSHLNYRRDLTVELLGGVQRYRLGGPTCPVPLEVRLQPGYFLTPALKQRSVESVKYKFTVTAWNYIIACKGKHNIFCTLRRYNDYYSYKHMRISYSLNIYFRVSVCTPPLLKHLLCEFHYERSYPNILRHFPHKDLANILDVAMERGKLIFLNILLQFS